MDKDKSWQEMSNQEITDQMRECVNNMTDPNVSLDGGKTFFNKDSAESARLSHPSPLGKVLNKDGVLIHKVESFVIVPEDNCKYFNGQRDSNNDMVLTYCSHPENKSKDEGNCSHTLCPMIKEVIDE